MSLTNNPPPLDGTNLARIDRVEWIIHEWRRGCSCSVGKGPETCDECTAAAIAAIRVIVEIPS